MDTTPPLDPAVARRDLAAIAVDAWEHRLEESPTLCTNLGLDRGLDRLDERGPTARARRERALEALRLRVEALPPDALEGEDRLTRSILVRSLSESLEALTHHGWEWSLDPLMGAHLEPQALVGKHPLRTPADVRALEARFAAVPALLAQHVGDLKEGLESTSATSDPPTHPSSLSSRARTRAARARPPASPRSRAARPRTRSRCDATRRPPCPPTGSTASGRRSSSATRRRCSPSRTRRAGPASCRSS